MKADHDLDTAVTEGSLAVIRERYNIPAEYGLHVPEPRQRPFSSDAPDMCISVDALEVGLRFPLHPLIEECLKWWRISPNQVAPNSWRRLLSYRPSRFPGQRGAFQQPRLKISLPFREWSGLGFRLDWSAHPIDNAPVLIQGGIHPGQQTKRNPFLFMRDQGNDRALAGQGGLNPASRDRMDLGELREMPKVSSGKAPSTRTVAPTREVDTSLARETPKASSKRSIDASTEQVDDPAWRPKKEWDEVLQQFEAFEKELIEVRSNLAEIQRLLKEARVSARKMDHELLQSVKALESTRVELPKQAVDRYKESVNFKEGLKRMGRVTYEYKYQVALTRFRALHLDSEVEEDPFTIHPEDALVPMKRQQAFDDSDPSES
ncbi:hypothetical protein B296_00048424 [Ensete ventricosum]|uniref:Transposase (putative) gypsy type domain-containing protein n=1 Tax=Ensete ventricosum TaxID=4639 RepID=A0A426X0M3_ENSVE|nr:hypothetical protein B296_00048424 [Ensete ventricosum]